MNKQNEQQDKTLSFPPDGMASDTDTATSTDSSADTDGTAPDKSIIYRTITDENDFNKSYIDDIELSAYKTRQQGKQLLITGHFINRADVEVNMIGKLYD
ncbi:MAG: hypothetical protein CR977_00150 [Gammaproteobacteria bacterium]|nr:MAG: hypothetical protein CR977_00150 [Gammaproteobacteria bacterium]